jgi:hypothetical protein
MKNFLSLLALCLGVSLSAETSSSQEHYAIKESLSYSSSTRSSSESKLCNSWNLNGISESSFMPKQNAFFQFNVGVGFLYFSGVKGDLSGQPAAAFQPFNYVPLAGSLAYNRTPLYESLIGYKFNSWIKLALSYQYQGGVTVQTKMLHSANSAPLSGFTPSNSLSQFVGNLSINALFAKIYFQFPKALLWKGLATTPYLGLGAGPAWQSWTRVVINRNFISSIGNIFVGEPQYLRQKISANAAWMIDAGVSIQRVVPLTDFSLQAGFKYNQWGQARSMGKLSQQDSIKMALIHPIHIRTVYSFAPYLGVQWNFPTTVRTLKRYEIKGRNPATCKLFFAGNKLFLPKKCGFAQLNVGPNFLYFSGVRGNLFGRPDTNFGIWGDVPLKGLLRTNRVPLLEAIWGYQFNHWIKGALSYQHFAGMTLQTKMLNGQTLVGSTGNADYSQFQSNLEIDALMAKVYFEIPRSMIWKAIATMPYLALGVGPSWQSWTQIQVNRTDRDSAGYNAGPQPIRQKVMANAAFQIDAGFRMENVNPDNNFSLSMGCRYNQWGQARNIGLLTQQGGMIKGLNFPVRIKALYSFAPYLGAQWDFPVTLTSKAPYTIDGRSVSCFKPFWTSVSNLQAKESPFIQFNIGVGFLYFSKIKGDLAGSPRATYLIYGVVPLEKHMIYNRTPLFEYLVGYRFNSCLKAALSYQHQGGVTFQTQLLPSSISRVTVAGVTVRSIYSQLQANLAFDSIMGKLYFELPKALIFRGIGTTPYLAAGVGAGWQTWSRVFMNRKYDDSDGNFTSEPQMLRQKISANCVWMIDAGFRMQSATPCGPFSVTMGCKYNQWGQALAIGRPSQQSGTRDGLWKPFRIQTVYSFAPYLGMQWNF